MNIKSKIFMIFVIFCVLLSISSVVAEDNQTDVVLKDEHQLFDDLKEGEYYSFEQLKNDINASGDTFDVQYNYKCGDGENFSKITIDKDKFTINGNNHIIDASNKSDLFYFMPKTKNINETDIVINNLTFISVKGVIVVQSCRITLNNVNFYNNSYYSILGKNVQLTVNNCTFKSNNVTSEISTAQYSDVVLNESKFYGSLAQSSIVNVNRGTLMVENCIFENLTSEYASAISYKGDYISVRKSRFANVHANLTAGAMYIKFFPRYNDTTKEYIRYGDMLIEECVFNNASSLKNGGVILSDLGSRLDNKSKTLNIYNTNFTNCNSNFGGAMVIVGGILNIVNSTLTNNSARFKGGAIYTSWCNLTVINSKLFNNTAYSNSGALYFDMGKLVILNSTLENNTSQEFGNAIYVYDTVAEISNSIFNNGGLEVYGVFSGDSKFENNTSKGIFIMNNTNYVVSIETKGMKLNLTNNTIIVDKLPSRFDARDWGWVTLLKDQNDANSCWAFASTGTLETALLKSTGITYDLSEDNLENIQFKYFSQGDKRNPEIGFAYSGLGYALSWFGVIQQKDDVYDARDVISDLLPSENRIHVQDAMIVFGGKNDTMQLLKKALISYGALSIQFHPRDEDAETGNFYTNETDVQPSHFVTLIGYDDNYPVSNFINEPKNPGAWIIKNSWGPYGNNNGFGYISYEDTSFLAADKNAIIPQNAAVAYIFENTIDYHVNYQTDLTGLTGFDSNYTYYSNEFISKYSELIGAVGTYFNESDINYSFEIYVNGVKVHSQSGISEFAGFRTIVLSKYIPVIAEDKFKVIFKNNNLPYQAYSRTHYLPEMSYVSADGNNWSDITLQNKTVCLKVYTLKDDAKIIDNNDISVDYDSKSYFSVKVVTDDGHAVGAGEKVKFTINGKNITVLTDDDGIAKFEINEVPGTYVITSSCNNQTYQNKVTVKLNPNTCKVIDNKDITVDYNSDAYFTVKVVSSDGKVAASKVPVTFKINGEDTTVKTDKNGIATFKLPLLDSGVYPIETIYNGISLVNTVTVLPDTDNNDENDDVPNDWFSPENMLSSYNSQTNYLYTIYRASDMKIICHSNVINLKALMDLFKLNLTNGHLKVYIDGTLVFDGDVDDDLSRVIFEILEKFLGKHEITVEFTDSNGKTQTLNETIMIE